MAAVEVMATYPSDRNKIISEKKEKVVMKPVQVSFHPNLQILRFSNFHTLWFKNTGQLAD